LRIGTWCALFALAIQLALSFGHVHGVAQASAFGAIASLSDHGTSAAKPAGLAAPNKPDGLAVDICAICVATSLAGNAFMAVAPSLSAPVAGRPTLLRPAPDAAPAASTRRVFQARAPPIG
jgi:hypothetical protein